MMSQENPAMRTWVQNARNIFQDDRNLMTEHALSDSDKCAILSVVARDLGGALCLLVI